MWYLIVSFADLCPLDYFAQARLSLHLSKCHIVGNLMTWLKFSKSKMLVLIAISNNAKIQTLLFSHLRALIDCLKCMDKVD